MAETKLEKIDEKMQALAVQKKQIKAKEAAKKKKAENQQKMILGGLLLKKARSNEKTKQWLLNAIGTEVTKATDKKALESLASELEKLTITPERNSPENTVNSEHSAHNLRD